MVLPNPYFLKLQMSDDALIQIILNIGMGKCLFSHVCGKYHFVKMELSRSGGGIKNINIALKSFCEFDIK